MADSPETREMVMRAWKDESYRDSLPEDVRSSLPPRPDDYEKLSDDQLEQAAGGTTPAIGAGAAVIAGGITLGKGISDLMTDD